ncbi:MAG TPA: hypothetical protein VF252_00955 [Gemmatimonadales bacterium]
MGTNIDRADWHYSAGNYPGDLPPENGGTHIGMYLAWIVHHGLGSAMLQKYARDSLPLLRERKVTGRQLLFSELDEKLFYSLLTKVGKDFTRVYYDDTGCYLADYEGVLGEGLPTLYHVEDSWENYDKLATAIDQRFFRWQQGEQPPMSPELAAFRQAEEEYFEVIAEAARKLSTDPAGAVAALERYLAGEPLDAFRAQALKELEAVRAKLR